MKAIVLKDLATGEEVAPVKDPRKESRAARSVSDMNLLIGVLKGLGLLTRDVICIDVEVPARGA